MNEYFNTHSKHFVGSRKPFLFVFVLIWHLNIISSRFNSISFSQQHIEAAPAAGQGADHVPAPDGRIQSGGLQQDHRSHHQQAQELKERPGVCRFQKYINHISTRLKYKSLVEIIITNIYYYVYKYFTCYLYLHSKC